MQYVFTGLYNHHQYLILERFSHPKKKPVCWLVVTPHFPHPQPLAISDWLCLYRFASSVSLFT